MSDDVMDILFLYAEEPVHVGVGQGLGAIDQPIQREVYTNFPVLHGSSVRGALRDLVKQHDKDLALWLFGNEPGQQPMWQGAVSPHDARIILFPVQSLMGGFAWTTCPAALAVLRRNLEVCEKRPCWDVPDPVEDGECLVPESGEDTPSNVVFRSDDASEHVQLIRYDFTVSRHDKFDLTDLSRWLVHSAMPQGDEFDFWRSKLQTSLVVLSDADFKWFVENATQTMTRVRLTAEKTVDVGGLWSEEALPPETLLHSPVAARSVLTNDSGARDTPKTTKPAKDAMAEAWKTVRGRMNIGGTESIGRGRVAVRWLKGE
ncbi:MAG: type III-B CRISPR module RAMP protein Cmr4 [Armatimonadota bacterium]|nr:type III-B CRISPR module RAMP protein Cmr4 [Armatimonadota bacterium]